MVASKDINKFPGLVNFTLSGKDFEELVRIFEVRRLAWIICVGSKPKHRCPYERDRGRFAAYRGEVCGNRAETDLKMLALKRTVMRQKAKDC